MENGIQKGAKGRPEGRRVRNIGSEGEEEVNCNIRGEKRGWER